MKNVIFAQMVSLKGSFPYGNYLCEFVFENKHILGVIRTGDRIKKIMKRAIRKGGIVKWLPLMGGMLFSFGILWIDGKKLIEDEMFFGEGLFAEISNMNAEKIAYLVYLMKIRGLQAAFLLFMNCIHRRKLGLSIWAWMTGNGFGIGCYAMVKRWEWLGIPGYLFVLLPHYLCYFYAYAQYYDIDYMGQNQRPKSGGSEGIWLRLVAVAGVVIIGILLECYVNPFFIKLFFKLFL